MMNIYIGPAYQVLRFVLNEIVYVVNINMDGSVYMSEYEINVMINQNKDL